MQSATMPEHFKLQYDSAAIAEAVARIGKEVSAWAHKVRVDTGSDLLAIPVLRGGIFFFADLVRRVDCSIEVAPARAWAYETTQFATQREKIGLNIDGVPSTNRSILIIDDICDSGRTMKALTESFKEAGAREVRTACLIRRVFDKQVFAPDWVGFEYSGTEWFVGYGMEDRERWRNLSSIYVMPPQE